MLHFLCAPGYQRKAQRPETEADHLANRLLLHRTVSGCDPGRLSLTSACSLYQSSRPAYTRRVCQVSAVEGYLIVETQDMLQHDYTFSAVWTLPKYTTV